MLSARTIRAMALVSMLLLSACSRSAEAAVSNFYSSLGSGKLTEAQSYMSAQVVGMLGPEKTKAALARESERITRCGGIKSIDVSLQGEGEIRFGTVTVTYAGNCAAKQENVKLVREGGKWKLGSTK